MISFNQGRRDLLQLLSKYFEVHVTLEDKSLPPETIQHGLLSGQDLHSLLAKAKVCDYLCIMKLDMNIFYQVKVVNKSSAI